MSKSMQTMKFLHSYAQVKVWLLMMLAVFTVQSRAMTNIEKLETQAGYQIINLGEISMVENYINILHIIDINEFRSTLAIIEGNINVTFLYVRDTAIMNQLWNEIKKIKHNLKTLVSHRNKRGLVNIGGRALNWIFGVMDDDDRSKIEEHLKTIDINNHNIIDNVNKQIKINTDLQNNLKILQDRINESNKLMKNIITQRDIKQWHFLSVLNDLQLLDSEIDKVQGNIMFAKYNIMSKSILTPEEIETYEIDVNKFKEIKCSMLQADEKLILVVSIPNLSQNVAIKYKLIAVPNANKEEIIIPDENVLFYKEQTYVNNEERYIKKLKEASSCTKSLINKRYEYCSKQRSSKYEIVEITPNMIIVKNAENVSLIDGNNKNIILNNNYIIYYSNCTLKINNVMFSNKEIVTNKNTIIPIYSKPENVNFTINLDDIHLKQIENVEKIKEVDVNLKSNSIISYSTLSFMIISLSICLILYLMKIKKYKIRFPKSKKNKNVKEIMNAQESIELKEGGVMYQSSPLSL